MSVFSECFRRDYMKTRLIFKPGQPVIEGLVEKYGEFL
jgi:hypothetical protein